MFERWFTVTVTFRTGMKIDRDEIEQGIDQLLAAAVADYNGEARCHNATCNDCRGWMPPGSFRCEGCSMRVRQMFRSIDEQEDK